MPSTITFTGKKWLINFKRLRLLFFLSNSDILDVVILDVAGISEPHFLLSLFTLESSYTHDSSSWLLRIRGRMQGSLFLRGNLGEICGHQLAEMTATIALASHSATNIIILKTQLINRTHLVESYITAITISCVICFHGPRAFTLRQL